MASSRVVDAVPALYVGVGESRRILCLLTRGNLKVGDIADKTETPLGDVLAWVAELKAQKLLEASLQNVRDRKAENESVFRITDKGKKLLSEAKKDLKEARVK